MSNWRYTLNIKDIWENEETSIAEKAIAIATKIKSTFHFLLNPSSPRYDSWIDDLVMVFEALSEDKNPTVEEFNWIMEDLYDWGDQEVEPLGEWPRNKMCWIKTFRNVPY